MQRHIDLELPFVMLVREQVRVAPVNQSGVLRFTRFDGTAQVVDKRFPHQVFRKVAPRLPTIVGADSGQNPQPRLVVLRLQIAETTRGTNARRRDIDITAIEHEASVVIDPVQRRHAVGNLQRCAEDVFVRHLRVFHRDVQ